MERKRTVTRRSTKKRLRLNAKGQSRCKVRKEYNLYKKIVFSKAEKIIKNKMYPPNSSRRTSVELSLRNEENNIRAKPPKHYEGGPS